MTENKRVTFLIFLGFIWLAVALGFFVAPAQAGLWEKLSGWSFEQVEPTAIYAVEVAGSNIRTYEWESLSKPGTTCMAVFAESGSVGLECF